MRRSDRRYAASRDSGSDFPATDPTNPIAAFLDVGRLGGLGNGDKVSQWTDQSGNGRHATASGALRHEYRTGIQNGRAGLYFDDAAPNRMVTAAVSLTSWSMFVVSRLASPGPQGILVEHGSAGADPGAYWFTDTGDSTHVIRTTVGSYKEATSAYGLTGSTGADLFTWRYTGTHAGNTLRKNRVLLSLTDGAKTADPGVGAISAVLNIGCRDSGGLPCRGYLFAYLLYTPHLIDADTTLVEDYLNAYWATN